VRPSVKSPNWIEPSFHSASASHSRPLSWLWSVLSGWSVSVDTPERRGRRCPADCQPRNGPIRIAIVAVESVGRIRGSGTPGPIVSLALARCGCATSAQVIASSLSWLTRRFRGMPRTPYRFKPHRSRSTTLSLRGMPIMSCAIPGRPPLPRVWRQPAPDSRRCRAASVAPARAAASGTADTRLLRRRSISRLIPWHAQSQPGSVQQRPSGSPSRASIAIRAGFQRSIAARIASSVRTTASSARRCDASRTARPVG
jgi:hypothetical protein